MPPPLPAAIDPAKTYWLSGATLKALLGVKVHAGPGLLEKGNADGSKTLYMAAIPGLEGAFYTRYRAADTHVYLQGGTVSGGGGGTASVADYKVIDGASGPVSAPGQILYIQANCTATVEDGLMMPGLTLNSASLATAGSVPGNHAFSVSSATGNLYFEIGRYTATAFLPSGYGNLVAAGCIGNFFLSRTDTTPPLP